MNKRELTERVALSTGSTKVFAAKAVDSTFEAILEALQSGEDVRFVGFGTFSVKTRQGRTHQNPVTLEKVEVPSKRVVKFSMGKGLKEAVAGEIYV
jgi:DNA-binding protein HU-beta